MNILFAPVNEKIYLSMTNTFAEKLAYHMQKFARVHHLLQKNGRGAYINLVSDFLFFYFFLFLYIFFLLKRIRFYSIEKKTYNIINTEKTITPYHYL